MIRQSVSSSNLRSMGYDADTHTLEIEFHNGGVYQYYSVPESVYRSLLTAGSKGSYHHTHIKDHYRYRKVA